MTQATTERPARFVAELGRLERGPLAGLRRGLGGDERGVYWLEGLYTRSGYGGAEPYQKEALRLVAGLYALKPQARQDEGDGSEDETQEAADTAKTEKAPTIGTLMGRLYLAQGARPSTEKRFLALLDADRDGLGYQMRQTVMLLATEDLTPDWVRLTTDLLHWGDAVRRTWARDFYREISRETRTVPNQASATDEPDSASAPTTHPLDDPGDDADGDIL